MITQTIDNQGCAMLKLKNMIETTTTIEAMVRDKDMSYIEAVMEYFNQENIEIDEKGHFAALLSPIIIQKIEDEAYAKHMMGKGKKQGKKLPI